MNNSINVSSPATYSRFEPPKRETRALSTLIGQTFAEVFQFTDGQYTTYGNSKHLIFTQNGKEYEILGRCHNGFCSALIRSTKENITEPERRLEQVRYYFKKEGKLTDVVFGDGKSSAQGRVQFMDTEEGFKIKGKALPLERFFPEFDFKPYVLNPATVLYLVDEDRDGDIDRIISTNLGRVNGKFQDAEKANTLIPNNVLMIPDPKI